MQSRRTFLTTCSLVGTGALPVGRGAGAPAEAAADHRPLPDAAATVDAFRVVGDRVFGRADLRAARRLRDAAPSKARVSDLDRRLVPLLGRGRDAPAGLRSLSGDLDPAAVLRRLRRRAAVARLGVAGDHAVYAVSTERGCATLGTDGTDLLLDAGGRAAAAAIADGDAALDPAATAVIEGLRDADAFTGATLAPGAADAFERGHPARAVLPGVAAFGLGIDAGGDRPVLRARVVARTEDRLSAPAVRTLLGTVGVPGDLLADATVRTDGRVGDVYAPLPRRDGTRPVVALFFLVIALAVIGSFVLGFGSTTSESRSESDTARQAPQVTLQFERRDDGRVSITHAGGDTLGADEQVIVVYAHDGEVVTEEWGESDEISAGDTFRTSRPPDPGRRVMVDWYGENHAILGEYEVPE